MAQSAGRGSTARLWLCFQEWSVLSFINRVAAMPLRLRHWGKPLCTEIKKIKKICLPLRPYKEAAASSVKHPCWRQLGLVHIFPHLCVWVSSTIHSPWKVLLCSEPRVSPAKRGMINVCCLQAKYGKQLLFSDLLFVCSFSHGESLSLFCWGCHKLVWHCSLSYS